MSDSKKTIYVLGGGASGLVAAIFAARTAPDARVTVVEHNNKIGRKILSTGNGKCNLSNRVMGPDCFVSSTDSNGLIPSVLDRFTTEQTVSFFEELGLMIKDKKGYLYPNSEQAASVSNVLSMECKRLQIEIRNNTDVLSLEKSQNGFVLRFKETLYDSADKQKKGKNKPSKPTISGYRDSTVYADLVINTLGGPAGQNLGATYDGTRLSECLGITVVPQKPALVALRSKEHFPNYLSGVRQEAKLTLSSENGTEVLSEFGEMIFTDYGISGIPVFQLSHMVSKEPQKNWCVRINFFPELSEEELKAKIATRVSSEMFSNRTVEEAFCGILPQNLLYYLLSKLEIEAEASVKSLSKKKLDEFCKLLQGLSIPVEGTNGFAQAQTSIGGVSMSEVNTCFESVKYPGLFFAGEVLDVCGKCGGYNLQWAWATGAIAGVACGKAANNA